MVSIVLLALVLAFLAWLLGIGGSERHAPAPEDDVTTPIDEEELAEAERDLAAADDTAPLDDSDDDDWGPGTGRSPLPGII